MHAAQRRDALLELLRTSRGPVSATALARRFSVSRQIIVGDIALLRAGGADIASTPRGYVIPAQEDTGLTCTLVCRHTAADLERELNLMVDNGCTVLDVVVEHPLYGQLTGQLHLSSRYDVQEFIRSVSESRAKPLSDLTGGIHLHNLLCPSQEAYQRVRSALDAAGFLLKE